MYPLKTFLDLYKNRIARFYGIRRNRMTRLGAPLIPTCGDKNYYTISKIKRN